MNYSNPNQNPRDGIFAALMAPLNVLFGNPAKPISIPTREDELKRDQIGFSAFMLFSQRNFEAFKDHIAWNAFELQTRPKEYEDEKLGGAFKGYSQSTRLDNLLYIIALDLAKKSPAQDIASIQPYIATLINFGANPNTVHGTDGIKIIDKIKNVNPETARMINVAIFKKVLGHECK
jgi:hypothetical protein